MSDTEAPESGPSGREVVIASDLIGPLTVSTDDLLRFRTGLFGFPEYHDFVLAPAEREGLFWLQSVQHSTLAFLVADPFVFFPGYSVELLPIDLNDLEAEREIDVAIFAIVTLPRSRTEMPTANLQGPIAINQRARSGKQLALAESEFGVRCPLQLS